MTALPPLSSLELGEPWFLLLALLVPAALRLGARRARIRFPATALAAGLRGRRSFWRRVPPLFQGLGLLGFVLGLARPLAGREEVLHYSEGLDIVLAVDRSGSMEHQDMAKGKTRLAVVKEVVGRFARARKNDRLALVAFARFAELRCPFTLDAPALIEFLGRVEPAKFRDEDGTAIGVGLARAVEALTHSQAKSKVVVLLTDGENNIEEILPREAATLAKANGVRVYTIGAGRFIYVFDPFRRAFAPTEQALDTRDLDEIASETGGKFFRAEDEGRLEEVYAEIDRLEKTKVEDRRTTDYTELYPFALLPSIALFLLGAWLRFGGLRTLP
ncbi:MAG TPA: VWA domain-containing protein [Planctomycetota bacterium]|nr:VWA domain-containing protein [Planctomycetota bacterium]